MTKIEIEVIRDVAKRAQEAGTAASMGCDDRVEALNGFRRVVTPEIVMKMLDIIENKE